MEILLILIHPISMGKNMELTEHLKMDLQYVQDMPHLASLCSVQQVSQVCVSREQEVH